MRKQDVLIASMREGLSLAEGPRAELVRHLGVIEASAVQCAEEAQRSQSEAERVGETAQDLEILSARFEDSDRISPSDVYREVLDLNECLRAWVGVHMPPLAAALGPLAQIQVPGRTPADVFALAGELQQAFCALVEEPLVDFSAPTGPITPAQVHDRMARFVRAQRASLGTQGVEVPYSAPVHGQSPESVYGALKQLERRLEVISTLRRAARAA
jgi:hypothetical protein